jgi:hypothetical protein
VPVVRSRPRGRGARARSELTPSPRSFGAPRPRPAPPTWVLGPRGGGPVTDEVTVPTLLVAVKPSCDGCRPFYLDPLTEFAGLRVIVVVRDGVDHADFESAVRPVYEAVDLCDALGIKWPPFYVLVAPHPARVVGEGVAYAPDQVLAEIDPWLRRDSETGQWRVVEEMR